MAEPRNIAINRKARHDYFVDETFEAGLILTGSEVKSLRDGRANLKDSYARFHGSDLVLMSVGSQEAIFRQVQSRLRFRLVPGHPIEPVGWTTLRPGRGIRVTVEQR